LLLRRADADLEAGYAVSRASDSKGGPDTKVPLHPLVVEHLAKLKAFTPMMFHWPYGRKIIFEAFAEIQEAAGVKPEGGKHHYGFHDLRRAFATMNADKI
jgi:integrase